MLNVLLRINGMFSCAYPRYGSIRDLPAWFLGREPYGQAITTALHAFKEVPKVVRKTPNKVDVLGRGLLSNGTTPCTTNGPVVHQQTTTPSRWTGAPADLAPVDKDNDRPPVNAKVLVPGSSAEEEVTSGTECPFLTPDSRERPGRLSCDRPDENQKSSFEECEKQAVVPEEQMGEKKGGADRSSEKKHRASWSSWSSWNNKKPRSGKKHPKNESVSPEKRRGSTGAVNEDAGQRRGSTGAASLIRRTSVANDAAPASKNEGADDLLVSFYDNKPTKKTPPTPSIKITPTKPPYKISAAESVQGEGFGLRFPALGGNCFKSPSPLSLRRNPELLQNPERRCPSAEIPKSLRRNPAVPPPNKAHDKVTNSDRDLHFKPELLERKVDLLFSFGFFCTSSDHPSWRPTTTSGGK